MPATWPTQVVPRGNPTHIQNRPDPYPDPTDPARPLFRPSFTGGQPPLTGGPAVVDRWTGGGPRWFATIDRHWPPLTTVNWWLRRYRLQYEGRGREPIRVRHMAFLSCGYEVQVWQGGSNHWYEVGIRVNHWFGRECSGWTRGTSSLVDQRIYNLLQAVS
ncbi:hypothetical protein Tco_0262982 [Tanacetum coccineum]